MKVRFFAQIRELTGCDCLELTVPEESTIDGVRNVLMTKGDNWREALSGSLLCARNQVLCDSATTVAEQDEIAFFPPVTGG